MARKVDERVFQRMVELRDKHGLTKPVIAERLGLSLRTVNYYLNNPAYQDDPPCTTPPSPASA